MSTKKIFTLLMLLFLAGQSIAQPPTLDSIYGYIFRDVDGDCVKDPFETGLENWTVTATVYDSINVDLDTLYGITDSDGFYAISVPTLDPAGSPYIEALISATPPPGFTESCIITCEKVERIFPVPGTLPYYYSGNIGLFCDTLPLCPVIDVDIATIGLRPCVTSTYNLFYGNQTTTTATDAYIEVTFDLPLQVTGASLPYTSNGNVYTFQLGDLSAFEQGAFSIKVFTPCDEPVGKTYCAEAHAFPDTCFAPPGANWDGSKIEVTAQCENDSVTFTLKNTGLGDMANALGYIVIEDNVLLMQTPGQFQLNAGDELQFGYPADGSFYRFEADQAPGFPGLDQPVAWVEGCGTANLSLGFINQYSLGDGAPWVDIFCIESVNSYDPNDKQGFPRGVGEEHFIDQNVDIEYMIRFQNTGTAPAFHVEIHDEIPVQWLDPTTIRPGASSHAYQFDIQGDGLLKFIFEDINLPDSNANFEASQGYVKFRISQRKDVPLGTEIKNDAAIYFDFNAPIITNQTLHTVGKDFLELSNTKVVFDPRMEVQVTPNPTRGNVQVLAKGLENTQYDLSFRLVSTLGQQVLSGNFDGNTFNFDASQLPQGVYGYEIRNNGQLAATGKLLKL